MTETQGTSPTPKYWDGEGPIFHSDTSGLVHILRESGFDLDRWYEERKEATLRYSTGQSVDERLEVEGSYRRL